MTLTIVLVAALAIATVAALARGLLAVFEDAEALKNPDGDDVPQRGVKQNRMMAQRVLFQGLAILAVMLLGVVSARS